MAYKYPLRLMAEEYITSLDGGENNISLATLQNHHISLFIMVESNCLVLMLIQREDEKNDFQLRLHYMHSCTGILRER